MKRKRWFRSGDLELTILSMPATILFILFSYLPMFGIIIAFKRFRPIRGANFVTSLIFSENVGIDNFRFMFAIPDAAIAIRNTLAYNAVFIVLGIIIPVALAIMISQLHSTKLAKICQTIMFLPFFLSWVIVSYFAMSFLHLEMGLVNRILMALGVDTVNFYTAPQYWPFILTIANLWKGVGMGMVIYLAAIAGIDASLYEAAVVDGSSKWQQVKYITLPMLKPMMIILFILSLGGIFRSDFGLFFILPRGSGPLMDITRTIDVYVFQALVQLNNIGMSSAAAFLQSIFGFITIVTANIIVKKIDPERGLF